MRRHRKKTLPFPTRNRSAKLKPILHDQQRNYGEEIMGLFQKAKIGDPDAAYELLNIAELATTMIESVYWMQPKIVKKLVDSRGLRGFPIIRTWVTSADARSEKMVKELQLSANSIFRTSGGVHIDSTYAIIEQLYLSLTFIQQGSRGGPKGPSWRSMVARIRALGPLSVKTHKNWARVMTDVVAARIPPEDLVRDPILLEISKACRNVQTRQGIANKTLEKVYGRWSQAAETELAMRFPEKAERWAMRREKIEAMTVSKNDVLNRFYEQIAERLFRILKK